MEHQKRCVEYYSDRSVLLAHEMGTGKSITSIAMHKAHGAVIVCPAKLKQNWHTELMKMGVNDSEIQIIETAKDEIRNVKWIVISYSVIDKFVGRLDFYRRLICDESHYIKNASKRSKAVVKIAQNMEVVTLLSGTAIMNRPIELWNQLKSINAKLLDKYNRTSFSQKFCDGHMQNFGRRRFWSESGATNIEELRMEIVGDVDIVKKSEVLDIPPKVVQTTVIEFTPEQRRGYNSEWKRYVDWLKANPEYFTEYTEKRKVDGKVETHVVTREEQFTNVVNAKQLVELQKMKQVTSLAKVDYFLGLLDEIGEQQVIVFTEFIESIERLNAGLKKAGATYATLKDSDSVERFQSGQAQFFTANIVAGGQGLNLQYASNVFILDRHWTPGQNEQAEDRVHRKGQTQQCNIYYVEVKDTIDEKLKEANERKKQVITDLMG
jgi:SWI/SNF-related matrix-associated actin-dependent regulator 1 of chromatin subfamily A